MAGYDETGDGIRFVCEPRGKYRTAIFSGTVDDALLLTAYVRLIKAENFDPTVNDLVDLRPVSHLDITSEGVRRLIERLRELDEFGFRTKVAFVVSNQVSYGVSRMYENMRELCPSSTEEIRIFLDIDDAVAWLEGDYSSEDQQ